MSNKPFTQAGRRTPLSLSGTVTKSNPNKSNIAANSPGNNANGHTTPNANNKDSKMQQQKNDIQINNNPSDTKELSNKQQQPHSSVKQHQNDNKKSNEKNQNGVNNNKQQFTENKQQNQSKDKQQQQNANDEKKVNEKDRNEKSEKSNKSEKTNKSEKLDTKLKEDRKEDQKKSCNNKEEKKVKEVKCAKDNKNEEILQNEIKNESEENKRKIQENDVKIEEQTVVANFAQQTLSTPETPKSSGKANKTSTPINKTPIKSSEKTPQKSSPTNLEKSTVVTKLDITATIDDNDIEMEPLAIESSPIKSLQKTEKATNIKSTPTATSTPSKILFSKSEVRNDYSLERPKEFSKITGRKGIHNSNSTLYKTQSYSQFCTSKDVNISDSSMNVTVGSEVPDFSLSLFNRRRKRENSFSHNSFSPNLQNKGITPPKKARLDGFLSALSSPLSLLSNRFSKTSLKSSTLVAEEQYREAEDDNQFEGEPAETTINATNTVNLEIEEVNDKIKTDIEVEISKSEEYNGNEQISEQLGIKITDTQLQTAVGDPFAKNKRCIIM